MEIDLPENLTSEGIFNVFYPNLLRPYITNTVPLQELTEPKPVKLIPNLESKTGLDEYLLVDEVGCKRIKNK